MTRAVVYLGVSSARQVKKDLTEEVYSIPAQRDACLARIRAEGWTLVDEYPERGESARWRSSVSVPADFPLRTFRLAGARFLLVVRS